MFFENPLAEERLPLVERQIPMLRFAHHRLAAADSRLRINQIRRAERCPAGFALVAVGFLVSAVRASAGDVAVGQELLRFFVVILFGGLLDEFSLIIQGAEEIRRHLVMYLRRRAGINIERNAELLERLLNNIMVTVHHILRRNPFFLRAERDGHPMLVRPANHQNLFAFQAEIAGVNIRRDVNPREMSDMHRPVRVGQCCRYQCSFKMLFHASESVF